MHWHARGSTGAALTAPLRSCRRLGAKLVDVHLQESDGGRTCTLSVRAQPGARREGCVGTWNGMLKIAVRAPAEDGRANERLLCVIAELFDLRRSAVELVGGQSARVKRIRLTERAASVRARIAELLAAHGPDANEADR